MAYRSRRPTIFYPYPQWYKKVCREVWRRSNGLCEEDGCLHKGEHVHHLLYPVARRETAADLKLLCAWHHTIAHYPQAANDNFDLDQYELNLLEDDDDAA